MIHLKNYSISGKGINIFLVNLSETKYKREELMKQMDVYTLFAERFYTTIDEMCEIIDELCITDNSLFDYTNLITPFKVAKDYIYTRKYNPRTRCWNDTYYDIYLTYSQFWSLALNKVAHELITRRFPWLLSAPYTKKVKRYEDSIKKLPKSLKTRIRDIDCIAMHDNDLTIEDIINIYTRDGYIDSYIEKPLFHIHENGDMFLTIDADKPGHSLYATVDDLFNKDWEAIEKKRVFSICLYDDNDELIRNKWYEGDQKNAPYFNNKLVLKFKKDLLGT